MEEPTLEELEELEQDFDLDLDLDLEDEDDSLLLEDERYVSLDELRDDEYAGEGLYYKELGVQWDDVDGL